MCKYAETKTNKNILTEKNRLTFDRNTKKFVSNCINVITLKAEKKNNISTVKFTAMLPYMHSMSYQIRFPPFQSNTSIFLSILHSLHES